MFKKKIDKKKLNKILIWTFIWTAIWWLWLFSKTKKWKGFFSKLKKDISSWLSLMEETFQKLTSKNEKKK